MPASNIVIRTAKERDLSYILELGKKFGHLMFYQKDNELMRKLLPDITVAVSSNPEGGFLTPEVVGYYHAMEILPLPSKDILFKELNDPYSTLSAKFGMLYHYKCFHIDIISEIWNLITTGKKVLVIFQGGCHREIFQLLIKFYIDKGYDKIFVYNSILSSKPKGYEELGFVFDPKYTHTFWNPHKADVSTYRLGVWTKP